MPASHSVSPTGRLIRTASAAAMLLVGGCAQKGDFGRPAPSAWNSLVASTGTVAAQYRNEPASHFPLTDDERTLRDRAWRFLMPAAESETFTDALANLTRTRVLPPSWRDDDVASYHAALIAEPFRSPVSRYRRVSDDITADARLIPLFAATAARVANADTLRLRSLPFVKSLDDESIRQAAMRVAENRCLVAWVRLETGVRSERYRYALQHLLVEVPSVEAVSVERSLAGLDGRRVMLDPLLPAEAEARCGLVEAPAPQAASPIVAKY